MNEIRQVGVFLGDAFLKLWNALGTWGIFGIGVICPVILKRIANLLKKIFNN